MIRENMKMLDYNKVMEALEKERQMLLSREQYGAENVLVHNAMNVITELPIIRQPKIIRCRDCKNQECVGREGRIVCDITGESHAPDWYCGDGEEESKKEV